MKYTYEATFRVNIGKAIPAVGELMDQLNTAVASDGYDGCKMSLMSTDMIPPFIVTVSRELTEEEQHKVKTLLEAEIIQAFPKYDVRLAGFRRQSGNVSQSAA